MKRIVILGAGCGGLSTARALRFVDVQVTLVDREGRPLLGDQNNVELVRGEAVYLDARKRRLILADRALPYDVLVVAAGARSRYEREAWREVAPSLRSAGEARLTREKLRNPDTAAVIVGAGVAGVELAAAVARSDRSRRVVLAESGERILAGFPERLSREAERVLLRLGVEVRCASHAVGIDRESVRVSTRTGRERILSRAVLWAGGVEGSLFGAALQSETGVGRDERGRVCVEGDLTVPGHPEIFVIGDSARVMHNGLPLDGLATVAAQQGRYVASAIRERRAGYDARPFDYVDQGRFVILGRSGVGVIGDTLLTGASAWLAAKLAQQWAAPADPWRLYSAATASTT